MPEVIRSVALSKVLILENKVIKEIDKTDLLNKYNIDGLIRFQANDFTELTRSKKKKLMHFNMQCGKHVNLPFPTTINSLLVYTPSTQNIRQLDLTDNLV